MKRKNNAFIEQDKTCFQHDIAYGAFKDWNRRTTSDKILHDKASNIAENPKYDGYSGGLTLIVYEFFDKKFSGSRIKNIKNINQRISWIIPKNNY